MGDRALCCVWGGGQASVNPKAETVEELQGRRKALHLGMIKLVREDLSLALQAAYDEFQAFDPDTPTHSPTSPHLTPKLT